MPINVIILAGPGGSAFNSSDVLQAEEAFKKLGVCTTRFGDGETNLTYADISYRLFYSITHNPGRVLLFIMSHGEIDSNGDHVLNLTGDYSTKTIVFFDKLKSIGRSLDIFSTACYGGAAHEEYPRSRNPEREHALESLRARSSVNSTYVSLAPYNEPVSGFDIRRLIVKMASGEIELGNYSITAEQLGILYLTKALKNRTPVLISTPKSSEPLYNKFISHIGLEFTDREKVLVYQALGSLVKKTKLDSVIKIIETARHEYSIYADIFGLSLAICHAASGDMLENKSSFILRKPTESISTVDNQISIHNMTLTEDRNGFCPYIDCIPIYPFVPERRLPEVTKIALEYNVDNLLQVPALPLPVENAAMQTLTPIITSNMILAVAALGIVFYKNCTLGQGIIKKGHQFWQFCCSKLPASDSSPATVTGQKESQVVSRWPFFWNSSGYKKEPRPIQFSKSLTEREGAGKVASCVPG